MDVEVLECFKVHSNWDSQTRNSLDFSSGRESVRISARSPLAFTLLPFNEAKTRMSGSSSLPATRERPVLRLDAK
jgi:hypothetical protein